MVNHTGDGVVATFEHPNDAIRCAWSLRDELGERADSNSDRGTPGEIELRGDNIGGVAVHTAARIMAHAAADEILVSRTVLDLVAGSGIEFGDRAHTPSRASPESGACCRWNGWPSSSLRVI